MEGRNLLRGGMLLFILSLVRLGVVWSRTSDEALLSAPSELPALLAESEETLAEEARRSKPLAAGERLDPNRTREDELDRLPGIGPATARAVVAHREEHGGFSRAEDLLLVPGIGPAKLQRIQPFLDFTESMPMELFRKRRDGVATGERDGGAEGEGPLGRGTDDRGGKGRIDLNRATAEELQSLKGIGPVLAARILESRRRSGPFRNPEDLLRVPGIGPVTLAGIRDQLKSGG
jgi:competence protein ComEA